MTFQSLIKKARKEQGLSLNALEKRSGVSDSCIGYYENGGNPTIDKADAILKALGKMMVIGEVMPESNVREAAKGEQIVDWISVRDRLPEDQEEVLVCTLSKNGMRNIDKGYMAIDHFIHRGRAQVTHWMPLPEMPKEDK